MLLLTGSGTAAMEMAISSVVPPGKKLLVIANGAFGERLDEIAALHGIPRVTLRYPWGELPNAARRGARARRRPRHRGGGDDPARDVGRAAEPGRRDRAALPRARRHADRRRGLGAGRRGRRRRARRRRHLLLVGEQVPALGVGRVVPVRRARGLAAHRRHRAARLLPGSRCATAATSTSCARRRSRPRCRRSSRSRPRSTSWPSRGACPRAASSTASATLRIRRVFADLGFESFTNTGRESHTISMLRLPDGLTVDALYDGMKARGFIIYRAKGELAERLHPDRRTWASSPTRPSTRSWRRSTDVVARRARDAPPRAARSGR